MRIIAACAVVVAALLVAEPALAAGAHGITCGDPQNGGTILVLLKSPGGQYEPHNVPIDANMDAEQKAARIANYVNDNSTLFVATATGNSVEFTMPVTEVHVANCGFITDTSEAPDLILHDVVQSDNKSGIVSLTGTPSTGIAYAGIPGVAEADVSTSSYSSAVDVLNALRVELYTLGLTNAYISSAGELVIPITTGTAIIWGTTDDSLTSGVEIE